MRHYCAPEFYAAILAKVCRAASPQISRQPLPQRNATTGRTPKYQDFISQKGISNTRPIPGHENAMPHF
jgi:hypothetical protein